jgi:hypothetical protein
MYGKESEFQEARHEVAQDGEAFGDKARTTCKATPIDTSIARDAL